MIRLTTHYFAPAMLATLCMFQDVDPALVSDVKAQHPAVQQDGQLKELAEDMEVFATIVRENTESVFRTATLESPADNSVGEPLFDYLPGSGVIVQLRIPTISSHTTQATGTKPPKISRWEATRRRLRGNVINAPFFRDTCTECHVASPELWRHFTQRDYYKVADRFHRLPLYQWMQKGMIARPAPPVLVQAMIQTLAENGHHVRGLQQDERITITLSYWSSAPNAPELQPPSTIPDAEEDDAEEDDEVSSTDQAVPDHQPQQAPRNVIDEFIMEQWLHGKDGDTDRADMIRRTYLDLVGRLPTTQEVREFLKDDSAGAYERFINRMLNTPSMSEPAAGHSSESAYGVQPTGTGRLPSHSRISVSATAQQLAAVAAGEVSLPEFSHQVEVRAFTPAAEMP